MKWKESLSRTPEEQQLLQQFSDIFPKELPKVLPPSRKVDHAIELILGAKSPLRPIYQLSYEETNELKK